MSGAINVPQLYAVRAGGFEVAAATQRGARSEVNEDRIRVCGWGFCVFDGIGGCGAGEVFAELAANTVCRGLLRGKDPEGALGEASRDLASLGREVLGFPGGATGCACALSGGSCRLAAMGDVRAFLVGREGVEEVCGAQAGTGGEYLGDGRSAPRVWRMSVGCLGTRVLLVCSDGLWRFVGAREVAEAVRGSCSLGEGAACLVDLARSCASPDDVSVALCRPLTESCAGTLREGRTVGGSQRRKEWQCPFPSTT